MAKSKTHYYVLVFTSSGAKFVTGLDYETKTAVWDGTSKPYEMSKERARDIAVGLMWNGFRATITCTEWEEETQPYNYANYEFKIERKETQGVE